jgi:outer membrane protein insertion porin family
MFRFFFLKILFLYFISQNFLYSQIIDIIEVKGNKRFTPESIIIFSKLKVGKKLNENEINESLKDLYDTGFFEDIEIYLDKNKILIDVKENPIIENLNITGIKKKNFLEFLYKSISLKQRSSFSKNSLEKDINLIYDILKTNGYYFSSIDTKFIENNRSKFNFIRNKC